MICHKCKKENETVKCAYCGYDPTVLYKTLDCSTKYYNQAITAIKEKKISKAIQLLNTSLAVYTDNYNARNLLGLCYFRIGEYGEASKHWLISCFFESENNYAKDYIKDFENNYEEYEDIITSLELYNKALILIKSQQLDEGIELLEEVVKLNDSFVEAMNLLTLCYVHTDETKAQKYIDKVLNIDICNEKALYYKANMEVKTVPTRKYEPQISYPSPSYNNYNDNKKSKASVVTVVVSVIACLIIGGMGFYIFANKDEEKIAQAELKLQTIQEEYSVKEEEYKSQIQTLNAEIELINNQVNENNDEISIASNKIFIYEAKEYMAVGDYISASHKLYSVQPSYLEEEELATYNQLKEQCYTTTSQYLYDEGVALYEAGDFAGSKSTLEQGLLFTDIDQSKIGFIDDIIYYLAKDCEQLGDIELAKSYYNMLLEKYPDSDKASDSKASLELLN